jgi:hypothetical protein
MKWIFWIIVLLIIGLLSYKGLDHYFNKTIPTREVLMTIKYDLKSCDKTSPLQIEIKNESKKIILKSYFRIGVKREDHSSNLAGYFNSHDTDRIVKPKITISNCLYIPMFSSGYEEFFNEKYFPKLIYSIDYKRFDFE